MGKMREILKRDDVRNRILENISAVTNPSQNLHSTQLLQNATKKPNNYPISAGSTLLENLGNKYDSVSSKYSSILQR